MAINTPTTTLEAVNTMLLAIGTVPVNSLEAPGMTDAAIARDTLDSVGKEIQSQGWYFNTSRSFLLSPSGNQITIPTNAARVTPALPTSATAGEAVPFVVREGKLWNMLTNSYTFTAAVRADIVWLLAFEALPESSRRYITVRAARIFQTQVLGDDQLNVFTSEHEEEARIAMENDHLQSGQSTLFLDRIRQRHASVRASSQPQPRQRQQG